MAATVLSRRHERAGVLRLEGWELLKAFSGITTHDRRLQRGLDVTDKAERVRRYAERVTEEVCVIAHSCGVTEPRRLTRKHARIMGPDGVSMSLADYYGRWITPAALPSHQGLGRPRFGANAA
jgi:hypothetical protein